MQQNFTVIYAFLFYIFHVQCLPSDCLSCFYLYSFVSKVFPTRPGGRVI